MGFTALLEISRSLLAAETPRGVPLDPHEDPPTASAVPPRTLRTRRVPPGAARASVGPPATPNQVRTRSTEPHGADLCPVACRWRLGRRDPAEERVCVSAGGRGRGG